MIDELYPNRMFILYEKYNRDEVFNICVEYYLNIDDICTKTFKNFQDLERYVYTLYERDGLNPNIIKR